MSTFTFATRLSAGTVGWAARNSEPRRPFSFAVTNAKRTDRRGRGRAVSSSTADPLALS